MKLRKLEIQGFKSFVNRTVLDVPDGVTAIVGPNGCGKSNIVDAIKWAMGEQSAKSLRGKAMNDVIFAGSSERPPAGMAEVSLIFELSAGEPPPVPYLDYPEIKITRILHRDGGSEYRIQNLPCRLKDIQDLLMGSGLGTKSYSVIEQGKIAEFISAKPEERRLLIEEAARITRFHARRRESEKNLEDSKYHLVRIHDLLRHEGEQIEKLKKQKRIFEQVSELEKQLEDLKRKKYVFHYSKLVSEFDSAREAVEKLKSEISVRKDAAVLLKTELETLRISGFELRKEYEESFNQLVFLEKKLSSAESEKNMAMFKLKEAEKRRISYGNKISNLERLLKQKNAALLGTEEKKTHMESVLEIKKEDFESVYMRWKILKNDRTDLQEKLGKLREEGGRLEILKAKAEEQNKVAKERKRHLENEIISASDELKKRETEFENYKKLLNPLLEKFEKTELLKKENEEKLNKIKVEFNKIKENIDLKEKELRKIESREGGIKGRLEHFIKIVENHEDISEGERRLLEIIEKSDRKNDFSLLPDLARPYKEYRKAVTLFLGAATGYAVTSDTGTVFEVVEKLAEKSDTLQAGIIVPSIINSGTDVNIEGVKPLKDCFEYLDSDLEKFFEGYFFTETLSEAFDIVKHHGVKGCVTSSGISVSSGGTVRFGASDGEPFSVRDEISALKSELSKIADVRAGFEDEIARFNKIFSGLKTEAEDIESEILRLKYASSELKSEISGLKNKISFSEETVRLKKSELERKKSELSAITETKIDFDEEKFNKIKVEFNKIKVELKEKDEEFEEITSALSDLRVETEKWNSRLENEKNNVKRLKDEIDGIKTELENLKKTLKNDALSENGLKDKIREFEKLQSELSVKLVKHKENQSELKTKLTELENKISSKNTDYENKREALLKLENQKNIKETELGNLKEKLNELTNSCIREFDDSPENLLRNFDVLPEFTDEDNAVLLRITSRIERLKPEFSLKEVKRFDDAVAKYEHLDKQREDLENAVASLEEAIKHITKTTEKYFMKAFNAIANNFRTLFPRLFGGGEAELRLSGENILESGVEIIARPPGKKLQSMELFSGGEKAMTSIAVLFSVFLYRPGPFCILDEVDAPLDDANVDKYNNLVRDLSKRTQFLVITHNRHTMAKADLIYGVTMEEPGCSKSVSMDLNEVKNKIELA